MRRALSWVLIALLSLSAPALAEPTTLQGSSSQRVGPSVRDVVRMALKAARHTDPVRVERLVQRARLAGLMPTLKVGAERGLKQDLSSSSTSEAERLAAAVADDFSFDASLTFDLPRLVFAPEEVRLLSVQRWLAGDQRKLVEEVVHLYFKRRKLIEAPPVAGEEGVERALAIAEIEAVLDAITDGAYGRALARSAR